MREQSPQIAGAVLEELDIVQHGSLGFDYLLKRRIPEENGEGTARSRAPTEVVEKVARGNGDALHNFSPQERRMRVRVRLTLNWLPERQPRQAVQAVQYRQEKGGQVAG